MASVQWAQVIFAGDIMPSSIRTFGCLASLVILSLVLPGCGSGGDAKSMIAAANDSNVKRVATMYSFFHLKNNFKGPKDEAELRSFISEQDVKRLSLADIDPADLDGLFVSERDDEPFVIRYGIDTYIRGPAVPVVFEATGFEGLRQVGFCNGSMKEVDSDEYDELLAGKADGETVDDGRE